MVIDDGGAIWLSNPWLAGAILVIVVGLVLWCHRWLETGRAPAPRALGIQAIRMSRRERRARPVTGRPALVARSGQVAGRRLAPLTRPRSAA